MEKRILYFNSISTGCSCCRDENFCEGPFETLEDAKNSARSHCKNKTIASQFAPNGCQETYQAECRIFYPGTAGDEDNLVILIPGNIYAERFGSYTMPADAYYYMTRIE